MIDPSERSVSRATGAVLAVILIASFILKLHNLGHLALKGLDESFHAIVAANLLEHPFTPTLIDQPYVPYDYRDWQNNHAWLHKGIVPLWQIALSYLMFGVNTFALRLPSALLSTAAVLLTYLIGRQLLDRTAALVAAALQAFSPAILMLVQGYAFSDHVDIALLFWVELGIWFVVRGMRSGRTTDVVLAGVAQGLAFLSKMYPALIVVGVAAVAWLIPTILRPADRRAALRNLAAMLAATVLTVAPWLTMCAIRFPDEFRHEYLVALQHLTSDIEDWGAPWDRLTFGYSLAAYYVFYPAVLVAAILLAVVAAREKNERLWVVLAWAFGVLVPFTLATSKTPSATLIGWPAFLLLFGEMISRAARGSRWMLGTWLIVVILAVFVRGTIEPKGMGGEAGAILRENLWIAWHVLGAISGGAVLWVLLRNIGAAWLDRTILILAAAGTVWLFALWVERAVRVTRINDNEPSFVEIGEFVASRLPDNAVLLLEEREKLERNTLMFRARRTTYPTDEAGWRDRAVIVVEEGGVPVIVSDRPWPLRAIFRSERDGRTVYQLTPADLALPDR